MSINYENLCKLIRYSFNEPALLEKALTHRSMGNDNNERFEFLGDALLSLIIADWLFENMPKSKEGDLSRMRSFLVKGETLSQIALELNLGEYMNLGPGEMKTGGNRRVSILADAVEAIIAAIYIDSNLDACRSVVINLYGNRLNLDLLVNSTKDPKSQLQEFLQSKRLPLPEYEVVRVNGQEHLQTFHVSCNVPALKKRAEGQGSSRRRAEQEAAENLMKILEDVS